MVNIEGLNKEELLMSLYLAATSQGTGVLIDRINNIKSDCPDWPETFDRYFDYIGGRPIKCDLTGPEMDTYLYNRDAEGITAEEIVASLRE